MRSLATTDLGAIVSMSGHCAPYEATLLEKRRPSPCQMEWKRSAVLLPAISLLTLFPAIHLAPAQAQPVSCQQARATDLDCDGIADRTEQVLLKQYRPYFRFSRDSGDGETFRPADAAAYLRSARVSTSGKEGENVVLGSGALIGGLQKLLELSSGSETSSVLTTATRTRFHVDPENSNGRRGKPWAVVLASRKVGLYGHVVPIWLETPESYRRENVQSSANTGSMYYKIEYWQFFGYSSNNKPLDLGDHEGDWDTIQLIIAPGSVILRRPAKIVSVLYYAHGKEMRFDTSSSQGSQLMENGQVIEYRGSNYNQPVPNLHDDDPLLEDKARNHVLRFYKDPENGAYSHPVVFVEHGGHEFWPSPYWEFSYAQKHGGDDFEHSYLTDTPPNLGEVEHPLRTDPAALPILRFNGYWGTYSPILPGIFDNHPPPGPPLHYEWTWPRDSSIRWRLTGLDY